MRRRFRLSQRAAGVLLHPTSLPGRFPNGDLGPAAYEFIDWAADAALGWWQMLPIGPAGGGESPYSGMSAFAGSVLLISPELLVEDGLLDPGDLPRTGRKSGEKVDFAAAKKQRLALLRKAFERFEATSGGPLRDAYASFQELNGEWLPDFAVYGALKHAHDDAPWVAWPTPQRRKQKGAIRAAQRELAERVEYETFVQFLFNRQWYALKQYATRQGVGLIGDIPIFVEHDSADVWAHQGLYLLDRDGRPKFLSGTPPDGFAETGQFWGHPLYNWKKHEQEGFAWWIDRFRFMMYRFDATRIDHFLGFARAWHVPAGAAVAAEGHYRPSPGMALFSAVRKAVGRLEIVAEDVGEVTPEAVKLRDHFGFPGLRIMQNGFGDSARHYDLPQQYIRNCCAYTGTHDNHTTVGWFQTLAKGKQKRGEDGLTARERVLAYTGTDGRSIHWDLIRRLAGSVADTIVVPMQDYLGLDDRYRMNRPGTTRDNWVWRMRGGAASDALAEQVRRALVVCDRVRSRME